jgi:radical SAM-linked protein
MPGVHLKWQHPEMSLLEGALSRGDRRMGGIIEQAWKNGSTFDGWTDRFNFRNWLQAFDKCGVDMGFFTTRLRQEEEPLPWMHMDTGASDDFMKTQWQKAHQGERVQDCRYGECHGCGVCDFKIVQPRVFRECPQIGPTIEVDESKQAQEEAVWLTLSYSKTGAARFFGHLELSNIFARAVRRAKIGVQYSKGFHPMPRLSFDDPLPLGMASEEEYLRIKVSGRSGCSQVVQGINEFLPRGVRITGCRLKSEAKNSGPAFIHRFRIDLGSDGVDPVRIKRFKESDQWLHRRIRHKGSEQTLDLRAAVKNIEVRKDGELYMEIDARTRPVGRPADFLIGVLGITPEALQDIVVKKLAADPL